MASLKAVREAAAGLTSQLRWFSSAAATAERSDLEEVTLGRYEQLTTRLGAVDALFTRYNEYIGDVDLEVFVQATRDRVVADYDQILNLGDAVSQRAREILKSRVPVQAKPETSVVTGPGLVSRLPTLELPHFDGRLDHWLGFINLFESLVDARSDLRPAQKLAYLLSVLEGEARALVQHLPVTDAAYPTAVELLSRRYQNKRCLADVHIGQILGLPAVASMSALRTDLLNPLVSATNALRRLQLPVDHWSYLLVHIVLQLLPADLRSRFEQRYGGDSATHLPAFDDLIKFLEDECRFLDNTRGATGSRPPPSRPRDQGRTRARGPVDGRPPPRFAGTRSPPDCDFCKATGHGMASCPAFLDLHVSARRRIANARRLCFSCLGAHFHRDCPKPRPCRVCEGAHLEILCANANRSSRPASEEGSRRGGHYGDEHRASRTPDRNRAEARNFDRRTPPPAPVEREPRARHLTSPRNGDREPRARHLTSPHRDNCTAAAGQQWPDQHRYLSPPLAERPRLESRPPPFRHPVGYALPAMASGSGHRADEAFECYPRRERPQPGCGDRSPPRHC